MRGEDDGAGERGIPRRDSHELADGAHRGEGEEKVPVHAVLTHGLLVVERVHRDGTDDAAQQQGQDVMEDDHRVVPEAIRLDSKVAFTRGRYPARLPGHQRVGEHERPGADVHETDPERLGLT